MRIEGELESYNDYMDKWRMLKKMFFKFNDWYLCQRMVEEMESLIDRRNWGRINILVMHNNSNILSNPNMTR